MCALCVTCVRALCDLNTGVVTSLVLTELPLDPLTPISWTSHPPIHMYPIPPSATSLHTTSHLSTQPPFPPHPLQASRLTSNALIAAATATASAAADASTGVPPLDTGAMVAAASAELLGTGTTPTALLPPYLGGGGAATDPDAPPPAYAAVGSSISATPKGASGGELGRLEALRWVSWLLGRSQEAVLGRLPALLPALLDALMAEVNGGERRDEGQSSEP